MAAPAQTCVEIKIYGVSFTPSTRRLHPTHWLISTQLADHDENSRKHERALRLRRARRQGY
jgi:hypothetical protein